MPLVVHTARMGYKADSDWLDVSLQGNMRRMEDGTEPTGHRDIGIYFAPSPDILYPYLSARKFGRETDQLWLKYAADYTREMRESYKRSRAAWTTLLSWPRVVLLCMCVDAARCHRTLLARDILPKLGATNAGEIA
jgi:hypothetical protein